jgi:conjugal transfer pilus assembly protein TraB
MSERLVSIPALEALKGKWSALDKAKRNNAIRFGLLAGIIGVVLLAYYNTGEAEKRQAKKVENPVATFDTGDGRLEDDVMSNLAKQRKDDLAKDAQTDKAVKGMADQLAAADANIDLLKKAMSLMGSGAPAGALAESGSVDADPNNPRPPTDPSAWANAPTRSGSTLGTAAAAPAPLPVTFVGDIGLAANEAPTGGAPNERAAPGGAKKNSRSFFLPVGFMPARLLTGLNAKTVDSAKEDPEPMLLRVQAPAVLPNEVRAQLEGCFVIAHGFGSLASERVEVRLVSLSCVDFDGRSVFEQAVKGIVVDSDGKKGLTGRVVSKMGANLSRVFVAGLVEGAGDAAERSASTVATSALGQTQTLDTDKVGRAAVGRGISKGAGELSKIYADLVRQSAPVIEVGPGKDVTILVTEGVQLEVKDYASEY